MRGPSSTSRAAGRQRHLRKSEPRHYRACRRAAHCRARLASASSAPCLQSSALDGASILRLADMPLAQAFHTRRPSKNGTTAALPPPSRKTGLETMDWAALTARCAPACLRIPDWAASTQTPGSQPQISPLSVSRNRKPSAQLTAHGHEPQLPPPSHPGAPALLPPLAGSAMSESWRFRSLLSQDGQEGFSLEERTSFSNWCPQALQS